MSVISVSTSKDVLQELIRVLRLEGQSILQCADRAATAPMSLELERALEIIKKSLDLGGKLVLTGIGKSGKIAQKIAATMTSTGSLAVYLHPTEGLHGDIGLVQPNDAVLALSYSGNTEELLRLLPSLKERGVPLVGLLGNPKSKLAALCDVWIDASVSQEACPHNLAPTSSTTLALALGDAFAVALMKLRNFNANQFVNNHPAGSIGKKLSLSVREIMLVGDQVGTLPPHATIEEIVDLATEKKTGAVLIVTGKKLLGIITDGDLRRALRHREKFFAFKAQDIMTHSPIKINETALAWDALRLMEDRQSQIKELPVVDTDGNWKGLIRLHDIAREL